MQFIHNAQSKKDKIRSYEEKLEMTERSIVRWRSRADAETVNKLLDEQAMIIRAANERIAEICKLRDQAPAELTKLEARKRYMEKKLSALKHQSKIDQLLRTIEKLQEENPEAVAKILGQLKETEDD